MAANALKSISRWHLVERNVHIDIKTKFGYKHWTPTQKSRREKVNDDKEVNHSWTRIAGWLRHHLSRTSWLLGIKWLIKRTCSQVFSNRSLKAAANELKSILRRCLVAFLIKPLFFEPSNVCLDIRILAFARLLHVEILFVPYLMNHSALKEVAIKINAPASTQITVGFVFL